jgi:hypothetical protein
MHPLLRLAVERDLEQQLKGWEKSGLEYILDHLSSWRAFEVLLSW